MSVCVEICVMAFNESTLRLICLIVVSAAASKSDLEQARSDSIAEQNTARETQLCLSRVSPLDKAEGFGTLCTSIGALYRQQQNSAASFLALKEEGERLEEEGKRMRKANNALQERNQELMAQVAELQRQNIRHDEDWQTAAKKIKDSEANENMQWQATINEVELAATKKYQAKLAERDAQWQNFLQRLEAENNEMKKEVMDAQKQKETAMQRVAALRKQKEAANASTSAKSRLALLSGFNREKDEVRRLTLLSKMVDASATEKNRRTLLALSREKDEVKGLLEQVKALQSENAQLLQSCGAG